MVIGIDGNEANVEKRVGVNQYAFDILWAIYDLLKNDPQKHSLIVYLQNRPLKDLPRETNFFKYKILSGKAFWVISRLMPQLIFSKEKPNVLFSPSHYVPPISLVPRVCTIHDLKYLEFPEQFKKITFWQLKYWTATSISISKVIIAVSNSTKKEIVRHYPLARKKIKVVHHGYDKKRFNKSISQKDVRRIKNKYSIVSDYILYIGTLKPGKNVEGVINAFAQVSSSQNTQLVVAGKKGWLYNKIFKRVKKLKLEDTIIFTDFLPEKDKPALMAGAELLISPSFTEGFGMHTIEAMACGTPVVVSKIDALEEVIGNAGVYVDPNSVKSIAGGIVTVLSMEKSQYNKLVNRGFERVTKFSWQKAARETLEVLESTV